MRRRDFITLIGGAAASWSFEARAEQSERMRRVGVLMALKEDDPQGQADVVAFQQALLELGWIDGRNIRLSLSHWRSRPRKVRCNGPGAECT